MVAFPVGRVKAQMERAFARAGNRELTVRIFPGAEHQLMVPQTYGGRTLRRTVTPEFLPALTAWVRARAVAGSPPGHPPPPVAR